MNHQQPTNQEAANLLEGSLSVEDELKEEAERTVTDWFTLGIQAYIFEAYEEALNNFDRAIDLDPTNARAFVNRGDVNAELGDYQEAFNDYAMAIHLGCAEADQIRKELFNQLVEQKIINESARKQLLS